jgi:hypothetical protein
MPWNWRKTLNDELLRIGEKQFMSYFFLKTEKNHGRYQPQGPELGSEI